MQSLFLALATLVGYALAAQPSPSPTPPEDDLAIRRLVAMFSDAALRADAEAFAALWTDDGHWAIEPPIDANLSGRATIAEGFARLIASWAFLIQAPQYGLIAVDGDEGSGRWLVRELGRRNDGGSQSNYAFYHDRYVRTVNGWRFAERRYEFVLLSDEEVAGRYSIPQIE